MKINRINRKKRHELKDTLMEVERLARTYKKDMLPFKDFNVFQIYDLIGKKIKYKADPHNTELIMRPALTLKRGEGDCDDKTVLFLSWALLNKIPCGYSIVSENANKSFHHIFPYIQLDNKKIDIDATYKHNNIGESKRWFRRKNFVFIKKAG
jgi:hypothetical protein